MLPPRTRIGVSMSGFAVECGWAIGEAVMIPHLLGLKLTPSIAGLVFVVNPIFSVVAGPPIGTCSDRCTTCSRRIPFLLGFSVSAFLGFCCLVVSSYLRNITSQIVLVFISFGLADLSHDMMLIPGRALLIDMTMDNETRRNSRNSAKNTNSNSNNSNNNNNNNNNNSRTSLNNNNYNTTNTPTSTTFTTITEEEQADATYTQVQLWGRLIGLAVVSFPVEEIFATTFQWSHFQTALAFSALVMIISMVIVLSSSRDRPYDILLSPSMRGHITTTSSMDLEHPFLLYDSGNGNNNNNVNDNNGDRRDVVVESNNRQTNPIIKDSTITPAQLSQSFESSKSSKSSFQCTQWIDLCIVLFVSFIFWFEITTFCFWSTSWLGLDTKVTGTNFSLPLVILAVQTLVGILVLNGPLEHLNKCLGKGYVWLLSGFVYSIILGACRYLGSSYPLLTLFIVSLGGVGVAAISANVYGIVRDIVDDDDSIGWAISMCNNTMPVAQILVGGLSGLMVTCPTADSGLTPSPSGISNSNGNNNMSNRFNVWNNDTVTDTKKRVVCKEIGTTMFFWIGFIGAGLIFISYSIDLFCLNGRVFREKNRKRNSTDGGDCIPKVDGNQVERSILRT